MKRVLTLFAFLAVSAGALSASAVMGHRLSSKAILRHVTSHEFNGGIGSFTPASADPRLAAIFAHTGLINEGFRFTPAGGTVRLGHGITVAVRARSSNIPAHGMMKLAQSSAPTTPSVYNLGVAVGWRKFALTGDYVKTDLGIIEGGREAANVGISFNAHKWSSRLAVAADQPTSGSPSALGKNKDVLVDLGGSYRLTRNLDLTAGVRYKREDNRLDQITDTKRDSQAIYIGTQFKF